MLFAGLVLQGLFRAGCYFPPHSPFPSLIKVHYPRATSECSPLSLPLSNEAGRLSSPPTSYVQAFTFRLFSGLESFLILRRLIREAVFTDRSKFRT